MSALGALWTKNGKTIVDYLAEAQATDGAVAPESETSSNRIWATSYAIPAAMGKSWGDIMKSFTKPIAETVNVNSGTVSLGAETVLRVSPTPVSNLISDLEKNIENKKDIEIPKIKINIREPDVLANSPATEISANNNLLASASDSVSKELSVKN